jgi:hypothetical protein
MAKMSSDNRALFAAESRLIEDDDEHEDEDLNFGV